jgi:hypothetical protein
MSTNPGVTSRNLFAYQVVVALLKRRSELADRAEGGQIQLHACYVSSGNRILDALHSFAHSLHTTPSDDDRGMLFCKLQRSLETNTGVATCNDGDLARQVLQSGWFGLRGHGHGVFHIGIVLVATAEGPRHLLQNSAV